jgi:putative PIG3 family NAD(P)H quinone oxidoreductase
MRVVTIDAPGPPDVLRITDRERPDPGETDVLIRVVAAGVNRADLLQRQGRYAAPPGAPPWPGLEVSGIVEARGAAVTEWEVGNEVCALLPGGGYADYAVVDHRLVLPVPAKVALEDAAALVEAACTVWSNLDIAGARHGSSLLVHGGTGGIGSFAIQYAAARGMTVYATAGTRDRVQRCVELGATSAFNHTAEDWSGELSRIGGVDIVLDIVGAPYLDRNVASLTVGGTLLVIGLQGGRKGHVDLGEVLARRARIIGTTLRSRPLGERADIVAGVRREVWPLIPMAIVPLVAARYSLEEAEHAHAALEAGGVEGKIVLVT